MLAGGACLAVAIDPLEHVRYLFVLYLLGCYLVYSLGMLGLVWAPVRFARGWDVAVHLFDFAAFSVLMVVTEGAMSPFFTYYLFLLVCGTLRWQMRGALWTAGGTLATYAGVTLYGLTVQHLPGFELNTFVIRCVYLAVFAILLAYLGAHEHRFRTEVTRIAAWPRRIPRDPHDVVSEVLAQVSALLDAPTVVLIWQDRRGAGMTLAWRNNGHVASTHESKAAYFPLVLRNLESRSFQAADAAEERGRVIALTSRGFQRRNCRPINEELRDLQAAGCDVLQIDEPAMTRYHEKVFAYGKRALERCLEGIHIPTLLHLCYGYPGGGGRQHDQLRPFPVGRLRNGIGARPDRLDQMRRSRRLRRSSSTLPRRNRTSS